MSVSKLTPEFIKNLEYTNRILPQDGDSTWKKVGKWALIILSLGTIFVATLLVDLAKKLIVKLSGRQAPPPKPITTYEKAVKYMQRFFSGVKDGLSQISMTSAHHSQRQSPFNRYGVTAGYVAGTTALFWLGGGMWGAGVALTLNSVGIFHKKLNEYVWQPLKERFHR